MGVRRVDGLILTSGDHRIASPKEQLSLEGQGVVVVQTKADRLGMYVLGQAFFSRVLIEERFAPKSVRTVALCAADDAVLRPIAERYGIEVVIDAVANNAKRPPMAPTKADA